MAIHMHRARVTAGCRFPLDMLRYDSCWPESTEDAVCIERSIRERLRVRYSVIVCRSSQYKRDAGWTLERWVSFGCEVEPIPY